VGDAHPTILGQPRLALPFDFAQGPRSRRGAIPRVIEDYR